MSNTLVYLFGKVWVGGRRQGNFGKGEKISKIGGGEKGGGNWGGDNWRRILEK